ASEAAPRCRDVHLARAGRQSQDRSEETLQRRVPLGSSAASSKSGQGLRTCFPRADCRSTALAEGEQQSSLLGSRRQRSAEEDPASQTSRAEKSGGQVRNFWPCCGREAADREEPEAAQAISS
ncbi:unnamed protein product, partial [Symbiodinium sp. CCMP2456]